MAFGSRYNVPLRDKTYAGALKYFETARRSRDICDRYIGPTPSKTYQVLSRGSSIVFKLYHTDVVTYHEDGTVVVHDGGWGGKRQTKDFIYDFAPDWAVPFASMRSRLTLTSSSQVKSGYVIHCDKKITNLDTPEFKRPGRKAKAAVRAAHKEQLDYWTACHKHGNPLEPYQKYKTRASLLNYLYAFHADRQALELDDWVVTPSVPFTHPQGHLCVDSFGNIR